MTKIVTVQAQQRWDYCLETRRTESSLLNVLNDLGQQGWDLVEVLYYKDIKGILSWTAFLKRPSTAHSPKPGEGSAVSATSSPSAGTGEKTDQPKGFDLSGDEFQLKEE
ncbi:MAG: hypothetical protein JXB10_04930 [Pirellulales bacterium]|nr:hypothetical protein [Pirellulales bacterium]